jgi:hypothetical protein
MLFVNGKSEIRSSSDNRFATLDLRFATLDLSAAGFSAKASPFDGRQPLVTGLHT